MPKTPVNEYRQSRPDKDYVRSSRQILPMKPITKADAMQRLPKFNSGLVWRCRTAAIIDDRFALETISAKK